MAAARQTLKGTGLLASKGGDRRRCSQTTRYRDLQAFVAGGTVAVT
jgi:hypothetical protein